MFGASELTDGVIRSAVEGSRDELERLAETMRPQVQLMIVARMSPTPAQLDAVEDVTQQVMVALSTGISRLETPTVVGLKAFVSGIVAHKVSDVLRGHGQGKVGSPVASLDSAAGSLSRAGPLWQFLSISGTSPPSAAERAEQAARLMSELGRLKPEYREVITLAIFDQLPMCETASQMGISRPAASMLLIRAVRTLRRNLTGSSRLEEQRGA